MKNIPIGEVLKEYGYITQEQLDVALAAQREDRSKRLGTVLIELGYIDEKQMLYALGERLNEPLIDMQTVKIDTEVLSLIPQALANKYSLIPIRKEAGELVIATSDPLNFYGLEDVRQIVGMTLNIQLAPKEEIQDAIEYNYSEITAKKVASMASMNVVEDEFSLDSLFNAEEDDTPVVKVLNSLLVRGYNTNASDVHIEPSKQKTVVRMRIDGVIVEYVALDKSLHNPLVARTKILANLDIAEKRAPQDGHFILKLEGYEMNLRVSVIPTIHGEKVVLRYLNTNAPISHSETFGMNDHHAEVLKRMLQAPHGIIYITGPTGSGKTTTLYMALETLAKKQVNISTIEDPVEKGLDKINQMQVNPLAGLTFETGLRALLRQDPDVIMVGETRDAQTAEISVRAAITGHLVLSTLHTNDAASAIVRLQDMGVEPYMIANSLNGVVAQRLMRLVCPHCKGEVEINDAQRKQLGMDVKKVAVASGCNLCNHTGYKNRVAIHEIIQIDSEIRRMIVEEKSLDEIKAYIYANPDNYTLREHAAQLVADGVTTMDEYDRITYFTD